MLQLTSLGPVVGIPPEQTHSRESRFQLWSSITFGFFCIRFVVGLPHLYFYFYSVLSISLRPLISNWFFFPCFVYIHRCVLWWVSTIFDSIFIYRVIHLVLSCYFKLLLILLCSSLHTSLRPLVCLPLLFLFHWNFLLLTLTCLWCYFNWFFPFDLQLVYFARACGVSLIFYI